MDGSQENLIIVRLNTIIKLLALGILQNKSLKDQVSLLSSVGLQPKQIAEIIDKSPNHVRVILHDIRKKRNIDNELTSDETLTRN